MKEQTESILKKDLDRLQEKLFDWDSWLPSIVEAVNSLNFDRYLINGYIYWDRLTGTFGVKTTNPGSVDFDRFERQHPLTAVLNHYHLFTITDRVAKTAAIQDGKQNPEALARYLKTRISKDFKERLLSVSVTGEIPSEQARSVSYSQLQNYFPLGLEDGGLLYKFLSVRSRTSVSVETGYQSLFSYLTSFGDGTIESLPDLYRKMPGKTLDRQYQEGEFFDAPILKQLILLAYPESYLSGLVTESGKLLDLLQQDPLLLEENWDHNPAKALESLILTLSSADSPDYPKLKTALQERMNLFKAEFESKTYGVDWSYLLQTSLGYFFDLLLDCPGPLKMGLNILGFDQQMSSFSDHFPALFEDTEVVINPIPKLTLGSKMTATATSTHYLYNNSVEDRTGFFANVKLAKEAKPLVENVLSSEIFLDKETREILEYFNSLETA